MYVDAFALPLDPNRRDEYVGIAKEFASVIMENGALTYMEAIADDVPHGKQTDWYRSVACEGDETVVVSFVTWPDKETRDRGMAALMEDERMKAMEARGMPFDGKRMFWGGFDPLFSL